MAALGFRTCGRRRPALLLPLVSLLYRHLHFRLEPQIFILQAFVLVFQQALFASDFLVLFVLLFRL
jgi:hypothetical protein